MDKTQQTGYWIFGCNPVDRAIQESLKDKDKIMLKATLANNIRVGELGVAIDFRKKINEEKEIYAIVRVFEIQENLRGVESIIALEVIHDISQLPILLEDLDEEDVVDFVQIEKEIIRPLEKEVFDIIVKIATIRSKNSFKGAVKRISKNSQRHVTKKIVPKELKKKLIRHRERCMVCGIRKIEFLKATYIKPSEVCNYEEQQDIDNMLLLCLNHEVAFSSGYITVDEHDQLIISEEIDEMLQAKLNLKSNNIIKLNEKQREFMRWHNTHSFRK